MFVADDLDRRERLAALVAELRRGCIKLGAPPALVNMLRAQGLLSLYDRLLREQHLHPDQLARLMREPPESPKAA